MYSTTKGAMTNAKPQEQPSAQMQTPASKTLPVEAILDAASPAPSQETSSSVQTAAPVPMPAIVVPTEPTRAPAQITPETQAEDQKHPGAPTSTASMQEESAVVLFAARPLETAATEPAPIVPTEPTAVKRRVQIEATIPTAPLPTEPKHVRPSSGRGGRPASARSRPASAVNPQIPGVDDDGWSADSYSSSEEDGDPTQQHNTIPLDLNAPELTISPVPDETVVMVEDPSDSSNSNSNSNSSDEQNELAPAAEGDQSSTEETRATADSIAVNYIKEHARVGGEQLQMKSPKKRKSKKRRKKVQRRKAPKEEEEYVYVPMPVPKFVPVHTGAIENAQFLEKERKREFTKQLVEKRKQYAAERRDRNKKLAKQRVIREKKERRQAAKLRAQARARIRKRKAYIRSVKAEGWLKQEPAETTANADQEGDTTTNTSTSRRYQRTRPSTAAPGGRQQIYRSSIVAPADFVGGKKKKQQRAAPKGETEESTLPPVGAATAAPTAIGQEENQPSSRPGTAAPARRRPQARPTRPKSASLARSPYVGSPYTPSTFEPGRGGFSPRKKKRHKRSSHTAAKGRTGRAQSRAAHKVHQAREATYDSNLRQSVSQKPAQYDSLTDKNCPRAKTKEVLLLARRTRKEDLPLIDDILVKQHQVKPKKSQSVSKVAQPNPSERKGQHHHHQQQPQQQQQQESKKQAEKSEGKSAADNDAQWDQFVASDVISSVLSASQQQQTVEDDTPSETTTAEVSQIPAKVRAVPAFTFDDEPLSLADALILVGITVPEVCRNSEEADFTGVPAEQFVPKFSETTVTVALAPLAYDLIKSLQEVFSIPVAEQFFLHYMVESFEELEVKHCTTMFNILLTLVIALCRLYATMGQIQAKPSSDSTENGEAMGQWEDACRSRIQDFWDVRRWNSERSFVLDGVDYASALTDADST